MIRPGNPGPGVPRLLLLLAFLGVGIAAPTLWIRLGSRQPSEEGVASVEPRGVAIREAQPPESREVPQAERSPPDPAAPKAGDEQLVLEIRAGEGDPFRQALVVVAPEGEELQSSVLEQDGVVTFRGSDADAEVLVLTGTVVRLRKHLQPARGRHALVVSPTDGRRGQVLVDGMLPEEPILLRVRTSADAAELARPPEHIWRALGLRGDLARPSFVVTTDREGRFFLAGLAGAWSGTVRPWGGYCMESGSEELTVLPGARDLVLRLRSLPAVVGRVVIEPGVSSTTEGISWLACGPDSTMEGLRCREDGRFRIPMFCGAYLDIALTFWIDDSGRASLSFQEVDSSREFDVGEVRLLPAKNVSFEIRDSSGAPIPGAVGSALGVIPIGSGPADQAGRTSIPSLPLGPAVVRFTALGHTPREAVIEVRAGLEEPVQVRLDRLPRLEIVLRQSTGEAPLECIVDLECGDLEPFTDGHSRMGSAIQGDLGAAMPSIRRWSEVAGSTTLRYPVGPSGRLCLMGYDPRAPTTLVVRDLLGAILHQRVVGSPVPQEPLTITLPQEQRFLSLFVVGEDGVPVRGARIERADGGEVCRTDGNGVARIGPLYGEDCELLIVAPGWAPGEFRGIGSGPLHEREVILRRGASLFVAAKRGGADQVIEDGSVRFAGRVVGTPLRAPDGRLEIRNLPAGKASLNVKVDGLWHERAVEIAGDRMEVVVTIGEDL